MKTRSEILEMLNGGELHRMGERAHAARLERFGVQSSFAAVEHVSAGEHAYCPQCGQRPSQRAWIRPGDDEVHPGASEIHVVVAPGAAAELLLDSIPEPGSNDRGLVRNALVGVAADWMGAAGSQLETVLAEARERGLRVMADGVLPVMHPARGDDAAGRWKQFWRVAAAAGMRGFASVFHGPGHDDESIAAQLEAISAVQDECGVFLSVCPVVDPGDRFGGVQDGLLTHGDADLRVLAACRLALEKVEHLTLLYNRSDLKMAHIALLGGVDDLNGHLELGERSLRDDVNTDDLSIQEMESWMRDAGMEASLRNSLFETAAP